MNENPANNEEKEDLFDEILASIAPQLTTALQQNINFKLGEQHAKRTEGLNNEKEGKQFNFNDFHLITTKEGDIAYIEIYPGNLKRHIEINVHNDNKTSIRLHKKENDALTRDLLLSTEGIPTPITYNDGRGSNRPQNQDEMIHQEQLQAIIPQLESAIVTINKIKTSRTKEQVQDIATKVEGNIPQQ